MKGYRPQVDWGGEGGSATIMVGGHNVKVGTSGWRRRCLFILLVSLLTMAVINLMLTLYMLRKIGFHTEGAGSLHVVVNGVKVHGISRLDHKVEASEIRSRPSNDLILSAFENMTMSLRSKDDETTESGFILDSDGLTAFSEKLSVKDDRGLPLFVASSEGNEVAAKFFTVTGEAGANFDGSVQTERLLSSDVQEFQIESKTREVTVRAGDLLRIEARDGSVNGTSFGDVTIAAKQKIRFESPNVFISNLLTAGESTSTDQEVTTLKPESQIPPSRSSPKTTSRNEEQKSGKIEVFQLCVCPSGRLFLAPANSICIPDENAC